MVNQNQSGAMALPVVIALVTILTSSFAVWGILRHWGSLTATQLSLDRCVGETAQHLRLRLKRLKAGNQEIEMLRAAIAAATSLEPGSDAPLRAALVVAVGAQDGVLAEWKLEQIQWLAKLGCGREKNIPALLPSIPVTRSPPDGLGPLPLSWEGGTPSRFRIQLFHRPRASAAEVKGSFNDSKSWETHWAAPQFFGSNFP